MVCVRRIRPRTVLNAIDAVWDSMDGPCGMRPTWRRSSTGTGRDDVRLSLGEAMGVTLPVVDRMACLRGVELRATCCRGWIFRWRILRLCSLAASISSASPSLSQLSSPSTAPFAGCRFGFPDAREPVMGAASAVPRELLGALRRAVLVSDMTEASQLS